MTLLLALFLAAPAQAAFTVKAPPVLSPAPGLRGFTFGAPLLYYRPSLLLPTLNLQPLSLAPKGPNTPHGGGSSSFFPRRSWNLLEQLGLKDKILAGGGITVNPDGTIAPLAKPIRFYAFDNDDNALFLRTMVYLRHKATGQERAIATAVYGRVRPFIGKEGEFADWEEFSGTFRDFKDEVDPEIFAKDVLAAVEEYEAGEFRGPAWYRFAMALKNPEEAVWTAVITSRAHKAPNMVKGYEVLRDRGYLAAVPREELIFAVGENSPVDNLMGNVHKNPQKKAEVIVELLDLINSIPLSDPSARHSFGFSDDDHDMISYVKEVLAAEQLGARRWPNVRISLFTTTLGRESRDDLALD
jgi:hypothetical protein